MYETSIEQMAEIKATFSKGFEAQEAAINALDFNPYCDEDIGSLDSVVTVEVN